MKKVLKLLSLPLALSCCSMTSNTQSVRFAAFAIVNEKPEEGTLKLCAYLDVLVKNYDKMCFYDYSWIENNGTVHSLSGGALTALTIREAYPLGGCYEAKIDQLKECSPVTFVCDARINGEATYRTSMTYNAQALDEFTISEENNNQELTTGYIKESTYPDHSQDYHYEDTFTFLNFEDLRVNDIYYDLDISYLRFKYRNGLDNAMKGEFRFAFYDRYNLFPDFPIGESMYRYIPLKFNRDKDECYFTFASTIYYNPVTHESSLIQKEGYIAHDKLMLPFSYASELKFLPCYLELKVHSHTDFTIKGKFMMTYLKKYFGDCEDSEFCDEMYQDDEINIREKVVEVTI